MDEATTAAWRQVDDTVRAFVGEADNLTLPELGRRLTDLGLERGVQLADVEDAKIADAILQGGYGAEQIASQLVINGTGGELPLNRSFLLWGQRYVIDSHAFGNVTWARTEAKRMMPDPLDVTFSVLGNNTAGALLAPQIAEYDYQGDLAAMRALADAHGEAFWQANLYNLWLGALRMLSPPATTPEGVPAVFTGEAFSRRLLNTQLASWAELRHDTLLYAKQSYTDGAACEFPDAYVEPVPEVWQAIADFGTRGRALVETLTFEDALEPLPEALAREPQLYPSPNLRELTLTWFDEQPLLVEWMRDLAPAAPPRSCPLRRAHRSETRSARSPAAPARATVARCSSTPFSPTPPSSTARAARGAAQTWGCATAGSRRSHPGFCPRGPAPKSSTRRTSG